MSGSGRRAVLSVVVAVMALVLLAVGPPPAGAHHRPGHDHGPPTTTLPATTTTEATLPTTTTATIGMPDPRGPLFARTDLWRGSQVGAWTFNAGLLTSSATARSNSAAANVKLYRYQMWRPPCDLRATNCQTTADWNTALDSLAASMPADGIIMVGLPPIWTEQYAGGPDRWDTITGDPLAWPKWVIQQSVAKGVTLFELSNEPDNYASLTGQQYYDQLWVNVPALKAYAAGLGATIYVGGPAWANSYSTNLTEIQAWLTACKNAYTANNNDRRYIPDFVSTHTYLITPTENSTQAAAQTRIDAWGQFYDDLYGWIQTTFAGLADRGYPIAAQLKLMSSEYNDTIDNASTLNDSSTWTDFYATAMLGSTGLRRHHLWAMVAFTMTSHSGGALDLLDNAGGYKPLGSSFASAARAG